MSALLTIRIDDNVIVSASDELKSLEIYAGAFEMNGPVDSLGMQFRLPSTLIYDLIKRECDRLGTPSARIFFEEYAKQGVLENQTNTSCCANDNLNDPPQADGNTAKS